MAGAQPEFVTDYSLRGTLEDVRDIWDVLWRGRFWIAAITLAFLIPMGTYLLVIPSRYEATAQILLDPQSKKLADGAVIQTGLGSSSVGADTLLVDSQAEIIYSGAILEPVVREQKLYADKEFYKPRGPGIRIRVRNLFGTLVPGFEPERAPESNPFAAAMNQFRDKHLGVRRVGNTYVINVSVRSESAEKAARLANAVADTYIKDQVAFVSKITRSATSDLESRVKELRESVRVAEDKVEVFRKAKGLIGAPGLLVTEQRLQELNAKLATARAESGLAKARYDRLRKNTASAVAAGDTSEALENAAIVNLRSSLAGVQQRLSSLESSLGGAHPSLKSVRNERQGLLNLLERELVRVRAVAKSEYELAVANERSLESKIETAQAQVGANKESLVRLGELERDAAAARAVLESFLVRVNQTSQQEFLSRPHSRIIAAALVPQRPAYPPTKLMAAAALLAGLFCGALFVWLRHILTAPRPQAYGTVMPYVPQSDWVPQQPHHQRTAAQQAEILSPEFIDAVRDRLDATRWHSNPGHQTPGPVPNAQSGRR